jgi:membrane fusion protein, multidrug efflux system
MPVCFGRQGDSNMSMISRMNRLLVAGALSATLLLTANCSDQKPPTPEMVPIEAAVTRVGGARLPQTFDASGTVESTTRSTLASKVVGSVLAVHVHEGDRVRRGQLLVEIEAADIDAQLQQAMAGVDETERSIAAASAAAEAGAATLAFASSTRDRYRQLWERRSISPQENDEIELRYRSAAADAERARQNVEALRARRAQALAELERARAATSWARITAPIDGIVTARRVDPGAQAAPGVPLIEVADPASHRLEVWVDESRVARLQRGQAVRVVLGDGGEELTGGIEQIAPAVAVATRSALVKIALPPDPRLRSGLFARARFEVGERSGLLVPPTAIVRRGQLQGVWVVNGGDGTVLFRLIRTGDVYAGGVEVLSGLDQGETIVTTATGRLHDGARIVQRLAATEAVR